MIFIEKIFRNWGIHFEKRFVGEAKWVLIGHVGKAIGSVLGLKILTQLLPIEVFGQVNLIIVALGLIKWVSVEPFRLAAVRMIVPSREKGDGTAFMRTNVVILVLSNLIIGGIAYFLIFSGYLDKTGLPRLALAAAILVLLLEMWEAFGTGICFATRLRKRVANILVFVAWSRPIFASLVVYRFGASAAAVFVGYVFSSILAIFQVYGPVLKEIRQGAGVWFRSDIFKSMIIYGGPISIMFLIHWWMIYIDRYFLQIVLGSGAVGSYVAAFHVAEFPFSFGSTLLTQLIIPVVFEQAGNAEDPVRMRAAGNLVWLTVWPFIGSGFIVIILFALAGPWIMELLTRSDYVVSSTVLAILAAGALCRYTVLLLMTLVLAHYRSELLISIFLIPGILGIPLSWVLVFRWGTMGAAMANSLTSLILLGAIVWKLYSMKNFKVVP